jgi:hypothetical protein
LWKIRDSYLTGGGLADSDIFIRKAFYRLTTAMKHSGWQSYLSSRSVISLNLIVAFAPSVIAFTNLRSGSLDRGKKLFLAFALGVTLAT